MVASTRAVNYRESQIHDVHCPRKSSWTATLKGAYSLDAIEVASVSALAEEEMFSAPVWFNKSFALEIRSGVSQCTDNNTPPFLTRPSYRFASYSGIPMLTSVPTNPPTAPPDAQTRKAGHDRSGGNERSEARNCHCTDTS